jgi:hypothetical protein
MNDVEQVLINFLVAFITACTPVVVAFVVAWIKAKTDEIKGKISERLSSEQQYALEWAARNAVLAAEQSGLKDLALNKKAFAITAAERFLKSQGFDIDLDVIAEAIEAAVWSEINSTNPLKNVALAENIKATNSDQNCPK